MLRKTLATALMSGALVGTPAGVTVAEPQPDYTSTIWTKPGTCAESTSRIGGTAPVSGEAYMKDLLNEDPNSNIMSHMHVTYGHGFELDGSQPMGTRAQVYAYIVPDPDMPTEVHFWPLAGFTSDLSHC